MLRLSILINAETLDEGVREELGTLLDNLYAPAVIAESAETVPGQHRGGALVADVSEGPTVTPEQLNLFRRLQRSHEWPIYHG